ncbi:ferrous iron transport protein A [Atopobacter sp. AH10]|uniref:FeoA family protein n=1 Tax=Atopobacter sp. AH10 TaxID=2315861 RepID=UPI000EF1A237|nr:FeoA family protein [Atopobacter sp. AH10]RLK62683.1 ferrous iron transport protein A [Atopobacter sp. AH10]
MYLADLKPNERAIIGEIHHDEAMTRRLWDLGFTKGTPVEALQASPSGDPMAYKVRETVFAIRQKDAKRIEVTLVGDK